jgi:plastocyanin
MKTLKQSLVVAAALIAVACSQQGLSPSAPPTAASTVDAQNDGAMAATVEFGRDTLGSPFPAPSGHDQSGHSRDSLFPSTVVISRGGTVTFKMGVSGVHQIAIYGNGKQPDDVSLAGAVPGCFGVPLITDSTDRINVPPAQLCAGGPAVVTQTFDTPGRYLVICTFVPHFQAGMYGWVIVKD